MSKFKTDIFGYLNAMVRGDFRYVDNMTDEEVKGLSPYVLSMWVGGAKTNRATHVIYTDMHVNDKIFSLAKYPRLLLKLFVAANSGIGNTKFGFEKSAGGKKDDKLLQMVANHWQAGYTESKMIISLLSENDIADLEKIYAS